MTKDSVIKSLRQELPYIKNTYGVKTIGLFGSYCKDLNNYDSDLDFLVEVNEPLVKNYFGLWNYLEKTFDKKIDLVRRGPHLREKFLRTIEKEIIYA